MTVLYNTRLTHPLQKTHPTTQDTMVQLKLRLATTVEDSIKWIQQFSSDQITLSSHNTETDEIIFDFNVTKEEVYQVLGDQCRTRVNEVNTRVIACVMVRQ